MKIFKAASSSALTAWRGASAISPPGTLANSFLRCLDLTAKLTPGGIFTGWPQAPDFGVVSTLNGPELELESDGSLEPILSPEAREGNWPRLESDAAWILIRQYFNDLEKERPADLSIERVGAA